MLSLKDYNIEAGELPWEMKVTNIVAIPFLPVAFVLGLVMGLIGLISMGLSNILTGLIFTISGVILYGLSAVTVEFPLFRFITYWIALPFIILGSLALGCTIIPSGDYQSQLVNQQSTTMLMAFPFTMELWKEFKNLS